MEEWLNDLCLYAGSSLKGRRESFISLVNRKKYIPVLISLDPLFVLCQLMQKGQAGHLSELFFNCQRQDQNDP